MNRIMLVQEYVDGIIKSIPSENNRKEAYLHTYGVAGVCPLIAGRRGLNTELAYISGLLHDIYAYKTGLRPYHSHNGAEMARPALRNMNVFSDDEKAIILSAVFHHADKLHVHDEYDEVLKDADVLQPFLQSASSQIYYENVPRLTSLLNEFQITAAPKVFGACDNNTPKFQNRRILLANMAEEFAKKKICGEQSDNDFMEIIKYYPEDSAFDELKNGWCAAFVYHTCIKAGIKLPIRPPLTSCRLAGVGAWYEWGKYNNFCFSEKDGFTPERGDIVIYNNIIPAGNKPADSLWHDHIGIVLSCESRQLTVAEGNIDNKNVSGVICRKRDDTIGCFVRIPDDYIYDGWKYDYKTGRVRIVEYRPDV